MKKLFIILMALALGVGLSSVSYAAITGSAHDFSGSTWSGSQICLPCHTPHNGDDTQASNAPLWNHSLTSQSSYTMYTSSTLNIATFNNPPSGVSKLCLSCHDGTVALDSYGGGTGSIFISSIGDGSANVGTDLSDDHPVSFTYDTTLVNADGELHQVSDVSLTLFNSRVECATCHDVHNTLGYDKLLQMDNANSALCLECHDK